MLQINVNQRVADKIALHLGADCCVKASQVEENGATNAQSSTYQLASDNHGSWMTQIKEVLQSLLNMAPARDVPPLIEK